MKNNDHTALTDCRECLRELKHYMTMIDIEQLGYHNQKRDELNGKIDTGITGNNYLPYKITKEDGTLENRTIVTEVLPSQKDIYKKEIIAPLVYDRHGRRYEIRQEVWYYTEGDCDCKVIVRDINGIPDYEGERCTFIKIKREEEDII